MQFSKNLILKYIKIVYNYKKEKYENIYFSLFRKNNKVLMLYRDKKRNDINKGKWLGLGGKLESGEDHMNQ